MGESCDLSWIVVNIVQGHWRRGGRSGSSHVKPYVHTCIHAHRATRTVLHAYIHRTYVRDICKPQNVHAETAHADSAISSI